MTLFTTITMFAPTSFAQSKTKTKSREKKIVAITFKREPSNKEKKKKSKLSGCQMIVCDNSNSKLATVVSFGGSQGSVSEAEIEPLKPNQIDALAKTQTNHKPNKIESYIEPIDDSQFDQ